MNTNIFKTTNVTNTSGDCIHITNTTFKVTYMLYGIKGTTEMYKTTDGKDTVYECMNNMYDTVRLKKVNGQWVDMMFKLPTTFATAMGKAIEQAEQAG